MSSQDIAKYASLIGLTMVIAPSTVASFVAIGPDVIKWFALAGTVIWFVAASQWIGSEPAP